MKQISIAACLLFAVLSCNTERLATDTLENSKSMEILNFEKAIMSLSKPENRPSEEELRNQKSLELSDRRKDLLIPSAKELIKTTGITEESLMKSTKGNRDEILTWAVKIYNNKKNINTSN